MAFSSRCQGGEATSGPNSSYTTRADFYFLTEDFPRNRPALRPSSEPSSRPTVVHHAVTSVTPLWATPAFGPREAIAALQQQYNYAQL